MKSSNHANLSSFTENLKVVRSYYLILHWNTAFRCVHLPKTISSYFKTSFLWLNYCIYLVHGRFITAPFHIPFGFAFSSCLSPCICVSKFNCCMTPMIRIKLTDSVMFHFWVRLVMQHIFIFVYRSAKRLLDQIVEKGRPAPGFHHGDGPGNAVQEIMIPASKAGLVIGKGGETIKQLQVLLW